MVVLSSYRQKMVARQTEPPYDCQKFVRFFGGTMACCDRSADCEFFGKNRLGISIRQYEFLVATYCDGELQSRCRRRKWHEEKAEAPPAGLLPNGYYAST
jgi:hypothetical protein